MGLFTKTEPPKPELHWREICSTRKQAKEQVYEENGQFWIWAEDGHNKITDSSRSKLEEMKYNMLVNKSTFVYGGDPDTDRAKYEKYMTVDTYCKLWNEARSIPYVVKEDKMRKKVWTYNEFQGDYLTELQEKVLDSLLKKHVEMVQKGGKKTRVQRKNGVTTTKRKSTKRTDSKSHTRRVSTKRKSTKRKSTKRKSTKRKTTKRKSTKRKSTKRTGSKSHTRRVSTKRKTTKRKSTKRKSTKRKSTKRKSTKRKTSAKRTGAKSRTRRVSTKRKNTPKRNQT